MESDLPGQCCGVVSWWTTKSNFPWYLRRRHAIFSQKWNCKQWLVDQEGLPLRTPPQHSWEQDWGTIHQAGVGRAGEGAQSWERPDRSSDFLIITRKQENPVWRPSVMVPTGCETPTRACVRRMEILTRILYTIFIWRKVILPVLCLLWDKKTTDSKCYNTLRWPMRTASRKFGEEWLGSWTAPTDQSITTSEL